MAAGLDTTRGAGGDGAQAPTAAPLPSSPQQQQMQGIRDWLVAQGMDVSGYTNDVEFLRGAMEARQLLAQHQEDIRLAQQIRPHLGSYQKWYADQIEAQRQQQAQMAAQAPKGWHAGFKPDPAFQYIERDENGVPRVRAGAFVAPGTLEKYQEWEAGRANWARQIIEDPDAAFSGLEEKILAKAVQTVQDTILRQRDEQSMAGHLVQQNSQWLWARNEQGQPVDSFGQPINGMDGRRPAFSAAGQRYHQLVNEIERDFGVTDPQVLHRYAIRQLQGEMAMAQYQQAQMAAAASPQGQPALAGPVMGAMPGQALLPGPAGDGAGNQINEQQKRNYLNQAMRQTATAGAVNGSRGAAASQELAGRSLREKLTANFVAAGGRLDS